MVFIRVWIALYRIGWFLKCFGWFFKGLDGVVRVSDGFKGFGWFYIELGGF